MKQCRSYYTPSSFIELIMRGYHEEQYKQTISERPDKRMFPPLPTGDEVLRSIDLTEKLIIELEICKSKNPTKYLTSDFAVKCRQDIILSDTICCTLQGDRRPLFACLKSPFIRKSPLLLMLLEDSINGKFKRPSGRPLERDSWIYCFCRRWFEVIENYNPDAANKQLETYFGNCRSTVSKRIQEFRGTDDEARIFEIIDIARAYPEMREQYLDAYCKEFKGLFGHG